MDHLLTRIHFSLLHHFSCLHCANPLPWFLSLSFMLPFFRLSFSAKPLKASGHILCLTVVPWFFYIGNRSHLQHQSTNTFCNLAIRFTISKFQIGSTEQFSYFSIVFFLNMMFSWNFISSWILPFLSNKPLFIEMLTTRLF